MEINKERRRNTRFPAGTMSGVQRILRFELLEEETENVLEDFGTQGIRFCCLSTPPTDWIGKTLTARMVLGELTIDLCIEVVHIQKNSVGCRIVRHPIEWKKNVEDFLDPIELGQNLRQIDSSYLRIDEEGLQPHWLRHSPSCDIYYWTYPNDDLKCIQVFLHDKLIEYSLEHGTRTGDVLNSANQSVGVGIEASEAFGYHRDPDERLVKLAYRVLSGSKVKREIRNLFLPTEETT
jgi:hypothetical protein